MAGSKPDPRDIPDYDPYTMCRKCGNDGADHFSNPSSFCDSSASEECAFTFWWSRALRFNHIHRTCGVCHFTWFEAPVDIDYSLDEEAPSLESELEVLEKLEAAKDVI